MSSATDTNWEKDFDLDLRSSRGLFATKETLTTSGESFPQAHMLGRAFDLLRLDGILCADNSPLAYFKLMDVLDAPQVAGLHRQFWNHGGAPLLVLIGPTEVQIYSGLSRPLAPSEGHGSHPSLVDSLRRPSAALREFLPAVESGEFFRRHAQSFNPEHRVDRALLDNLEATRDHLSPPEPTPHTLDSEVLDALLCRLVFTCYLFDRGVIGENYLASIGIKNAAHLRDILGLSPASEARSALYRLFRQLGADFNGDLFSDNLDTEESMIPDDHIRPLDEFFRGTDVRKGQQSLWPYDFGVIPVETISAIYERFLRPSDKDAGSFYTPRFLAEVVLDLALSKAPSLLNRRYLDPACGSGIFLVGLFNRIAQEWRRANPTAPDDRRARELMEILRGSLFGVDTNPTACRITAFSLYLAYLDQISPRDIQVLQQRGRALPKLVNDPRSGVGAATGGNIWCGDFFTDDQRYPSGVNLVIGNPPWGSVADKDTPAGMWCAAHSRPIADKQIATAFAWKAAEHVAEDGQVCIILPSGMLFNLNALEVQRAFLKRHAVDVVLNLADYQRFLFEEAGHPALVVSYRQRPPVDESHEITYWGPKADWLVTRAEVITISPSDQSRLRLRDVLTDLQTEDAPQIWKRRYWATSRDWRLLDRLCSYPRLRDHVRRPREDAPNKPWTMAVGFQPVGGNDDPAKAKMIALPSDTFIRARSPQLDLFLIPSDCSRLDSAAVRVRAGSNTNTDVFRAPHVLISKGFTSTAYVNFPCSFQDAVRGISGPAADSDLLAFLAAYLRTPLAKYFLFHTSSNWGISRQQAYVEEMVRLPFPLPDALPDPQRAWAIVREVSSLISGAARAAASSNLFVNRKMVVQAASAVIGPLVEKYFDLLPDEKLLVNDTVNVIVPSARPTRSRANVPTIEPSSGEQRSAYRDKLCGILNQWAKVGSFVVRGEVIASTTLGVGVMVLEKVKRAKGSHPIDLGGDFLKVFDEVRQSVSRRLNTLEIARGVKVFDGNRLYIVKPIAQRNWIQTAALNDADEIAGTILMHAPVGVA